MPLRRAWPVFLAILAGVCPALLRGQTTTTHTWTGPSAGEWGDFSNWSTFLVPNSGNDAVVINNSAPAPLTTTLGLSGSPFTARSLTANNASPFSAIVLGAPANPGAQSLTLLNNTTTAPAIYVSSGLLQIAAALNATQGFTKTGDGALLLTGPVTAGPLTLSGGELTLSGTGSTNRITHKIVGGPAPLAAGATVSSTLRLLGANAIPPNTSLSFDFGNQTLIDSTLTATVDLGGLQRSVGDLSFINFNQYSTTSRDSTAVMDIQNGALEVKSISGFELSSDSPGINFELRLPGSASIQTSNLSIGNGSSRNTTKPSSSRIRIGTSAVFRVSSLYMGFNGSSARIEARDAGATLTMSGEYSASRIGSIALGNISNSPGDYDTAIDVETGTLNLLANSVRINGGSSATTPAQASLRFGAGTVDIFDLFLGGTPQNAYDYQCLVVQKGGSAKIGRILLLPTPSAPLSGKRTHHYQLHGGTLQVGNVTGEGALSVTGTLNRGIDWRGGTLRNYPNQSSSLNTTGVGAVTSPIDLTLSGSGLRPLEVDAGRTFTLGLGLRLTADSPSITLQKIGEGTLVIACDSTGFTGDLQLDSGTLASGQDATFATAHAGALVWNSGTLACNLSSTLALSDRWILARAFTRGSGPAAARVLDLKSSSGAGTYTLATYASTNLTRDDFTATGIRSGYVADFTVGPTALTVTLTSAPSLATWRATHFTSTHNLGPAHDLADPDSDGHPNLLEYAVGSGPLSPDAQPLALLARDPVSQRLSLTFSRIADPALTYSVLAASSPAGPWTEVVFTSTGPDNTPGPVTVTDSASLSAHPSRFLRLTVSR